MIQEFVDRWESRKPELREKFRTEHPSNYLDIVKGVAALLRDEHDAPDPERVTEINHGDYQGTLVYVIGATGYQPSTYWAVTVGYGSCSGCDTLEAIRVYSDEPPTGEQVDGYMTLALHVVQGLRCITEAQ